MRPHFPLPLLLLFLAAAVAPAQDSGPLHQEVVVPASVADVWSAMTTKEGMESWMVAHAEIDLRIGGVMRTHYDPKGTLGDAGTIENRILSFDPGRMFSLQVAKPPQGFPFPVAVQSMWTVMYFDELGPNETRVRCVGHGFTDSEESRKMRGFFERGNRLTLDRLRARFATPPAPKSEGGGDGADK